MNHSACVNKPGRDLPRPQAGPFRQCIDVTRDARIEPDRLHHAPNPSGKPPGPAVDVLQARRQRAPRHGIARSLQSPGRRAVAAALSSGFRRARSTARRRMRGDNSPVRLSKKLTRRSQSSCAAGLSATPARCRAQEWLYADIPERAHRHGIPRVDQDQQPKQRCAGIVRLLPAAPHTRSVMTGAA